MDRLRELLETVRQNGATLGRLRGFLHVLIGRRVTKADGTPVSDGMTWRDAAAALKKYRWDRDAVRDLGLDPADLPPRDREKYWYLAISRAGLGTAAAEVEAEALTNVLRDLGYEVSG